MEKVFNATKDDILFVVPEKTDFLRIRIESGHPWRAKDSVNTKDDWIGIRFSEGLVGSDRSREIFFTSEEWPIIKEFIDESVNTRLSKRGSSSGA